MENKPNWPEIAKKLAEIKKNGDPEALASAMGMLKEKFGIEDASEVANRVKGSNEAIGSMMDRTITGPEWKEKIADLLALKKMSKVGKKIPGVGAVIGGVGAMMGSEDASAGIPILSEADDLGPSESSPEGRFERGEMNQSEFMKMKQPDEGKFKALKGVLGTPNTGREPSVLPKESEPMFMRSMKNVDDLMKSGVSGKDEPYDKYEKFGSIQSDKRDRDMSSYLTGETSDATEIDPDVTDEFLKRRKFKVLEQK